jgi:cytochrome oxidase assembly protein ShyY1
MDDQSMSIDHTQLDRSIVRALETAPHVPIAHDFAARVAARVTPRRAVSLRVTRYGWKVTWFALAALVAALIAIVAGGVERTLPGMTLEWILCAELVALVMALGVGRRFFAGL